MRGMGLGRESLMAPRTSSRRTPRSILGGLQLFESLGESFQAEQGEAGSSNCIGMVKEKLVQALSFLPDHSESQRKRVR